MEKINKLSLPVTILIASIILGGFYYATQTSKQRSIERLEQKAEVEKQSIALKKSLCVSEAEDSAIEFYKNNCTYDCKEGQYYVANYENAYKKCLQRRGLE